MESFTHLHESHFFSQFCEKEFSFSSTAGSPQIHPCQLHPQRGDGGTVHHSRSAGPSGAGLVNQRGFAGFLQVAVTGSPRLSAGLRGFGLHGLQQASHGAAGLWYQRFDNSVWCRTGSSRRSVLFTCLLLSGSYVSMDMKNLPTFWLAYLSDPSDSGRIHSNIRQRWLNGMCQCERVIVGQMTRNPALWEQTWKHGTMIFWKLHLAFLCCF